MRELRNQVKEIALEGRPRVSSFENIKHEAFLHFQYLYSAESISMDHAHNFPRIILSVILPFSNLNIVKEINEDEVLEAIWSLDPDKALDLMALNMLLSFLREFD